MKWPIRICEKTYKGFCSFLIHFHLFGTELSKVIFSLVYLGRNSFKIQLLFKWYIWNGSIHFGDILRQDALNKYSDWNTETYTISNNKLRYEWNKYNVITTIQVRIYSTCKWPYVYTATTGETGHYILQCVYVAPKSPCCYRMTNWFCTNQYSM